MALKNKIQEDAKSALKEKRETELSVLRMLLASIFNKEKEKRYKISKEKGQLSQERLEKESQLSDEEIVEVIFSEIKKRNEAAQLYEKGNREELVQKEKTEAKVLQKYLPEQMPEDEIRALAKDAISSVKAESVKDMGRVMAEIMPKAKGKADAALVSKIVKDMLSVQG